MTNSKLSREIIEMKDIDQELRFKAKRGRELINFVIYAIDGVHNLRIKTIIEQHGYPTHRLIGAAGMKAFTILAQHQNYDVILQEKCLKNCDFEKRDAAFLNDHILVNKGLKQLYGTQFKRLKSGKLAPQPIEDKKGVNARRRSLGLDTLEREIGRMNKRDNLINHPE